METVRVTFADHARPDRSGALILDDDGRVTLLPSPPLANALARAKLDPATDLTPIRFDDRKRGLAFAAALDKGVRAPLLQCEFVAGAFELRAYVGGEWVRFTLTPGEFDPDAGWEFLLAVNEAKLAAPLP